jgi:zinc protease
MKKASIHRMVVAALAASASILAATVCAQQLPGAQSAPQSITGVELKGKAPVNPETLRVVLPKPQETTLPNGMRVALLEDHKVPTFSVQLIFRGGGLADPADKRGLAMVTTALLDEGTTTRTSREIAEQLAALGASIGGGASPSSGESSVTVTGLTENIESTLALAADVIRNPKFPAAELDKFRSRFLAQLQQQRANPGFQAQEEFMRAVYGTHPAGNVVPPEAVIKALTSEDLSAYHSRYFRPNNVMVLAYGDLNLKDLTTQLERAFGEWKAGEEVQVALPELSAPERSRVLLVDRPGSVQASLWVGGLGIERTSADYFAVLVMNHILGGGPASRLFVNLREDKGYTYGVYSTFSGSRFPGVMLATTDVRNAVTEGAMKELDAELRRIATEPVPQKELENAKRALIGRFALSLDSPQALMANLATQKIYGLPADYWDQYPKHVEAISAADVQRVAKKYYDPARLQIVAVGDADVLRKVLEKFGKVETAGASVAR